MNRILTAAALALAFSAPAHAVCTQLPINPGFTITQCGPKQSHIERINPGFTITVPNSSMDDLPYRRNLNATHGPDDDPYNQNP